MPDSGESAAPGSAAVRAYADAVIYPPPRLGRPAGDLRIAVLDRSGTRVPEAVCGFHRLSSNGYVPDPAENRDPARLSGKWVFGGIASDQFGHQITRCLGRLPHLEAAPDALGLLYVVHDPPSGAAASKAMLLRLLEGLGVSCPVSFIERPTRVDELIVGPDLFGELTGCAAHPGFVAWIRNRLPRSGHEGGALYVTRTGLPRVAGRVAFEDMIEANAAAAGYEIFAPERASVSEQLRRYAAADRILTTDGSHLHLVALARRSGQRIGLIHRRSRGHHMILEQLHSFGAGLTDSELVEFDLLIREWSPSTRSNNRTLAEIDLTALGARLAETGFISATNLKDWNKPEQSRIAAERASSLYPGEWLLPIEDRPAFISWLNQQKRASREMEDDTLATRDVPAIDGMGYHDFLRELHVRLQPEWYLEIGTFRGDSLQLARRCAIAVDPSFRLRRMPEFVGESQIHFFQMRSDAFFDTGFLARNGIAPKLAFLDGLHHFEVLLDDFIRTEKAMAPDGLVALHDCCPSTSAMTAREQIPGLWTGDVWKTLLILLRYRPDLDIRVVSAAPTGLVIVRGLDPKSTVLTDRMPDIVEAYGNLAIDDLPGGLAGLYKHFELTAPEVFLSELGV